MFYRKIKPLLWRELAFIQDRLFQIFFPISVNWSYKLAVDLQKDEVLPVSHLLSSLNIIPTCHQAPWGLAKLAIKLALMVPMEPGQDSALNKHFCCHGKQI